MWLWPGGGGYLSLGPLDVHAQHLSRSPNNYNNILISSESRYAASIKTVSSFCSYFRMPQVHDKQTENYRWAIFEGDNFPLVASSSVQYSLFMNEKKPSKNTSRHTIFRNQN